MGNPRNSRNTRGERATGSPGQVPLAPEKTSGSTAKDFSAPEVPSDRQLEEMSQLVGSIIPIPAQSIRVDVLITLGEAFDQYVDAYWEAMDYTARSQGGMVPGVSPQDWRRYCRSLAHSRIMWTRKNLPGWARPVIQPTDRVAVPTALGLLLGSTGRVVVEDEDLEFAPIIAALSPEERMESSEAEAIGRRILVMRNHGFNLGIGYPRDVNGSSYLMQFQFNNGVAYTHTASAPPAYAVMARMFELKRTQIVDRDRQVYALEDRLNLVIDRLVEM